MTSLALLDSDETIVPWLGPATQLIAEAFPRPAMETNAELLAWHLTSSLGRLTGLAAIATVDSALVGFAGATPRRLTCGGATATAHVVSFVAVAASMRGRGVAAQLYDTLLAGMPPDSRVLTFAIDDSPGMAALGNAYPRNGFTGQALGLFPPYAALRQRVGSGTAAGSAASELTIELGDDAATARHLDTDPRGARRVGTRGARAIAAWRLTADGREPLLLLENVRAPLDSEELRATTVDAFAAFAEHGKMLVAPSFPPTAADVAQAVGFRKLAGPVYRAWIWCRDPADPFLQARSTSHPIL